MSMIVPRTLTRLTKRIYVCERAKHVSREEVAAPDSYSKVADKVIVGPNVWCT